MRTFLVAHRWLALNRRTVLQISAAVAIPILSAAIARSASPRQTSLILALLLGSAVALVLLHRPWLGFLVIFPASFLVPLEIGTGSGSSINAPMLLVALMLGLWLMEMVVIKRRVHIEPSRPLLPLIAFLVISTLAFIVGQLPWFPGIQNAPLRAQMGGLGVFVLSAGAFLLTAHQLRQLRWLKAMTWVFLAVGSLFVASKIASGPGWHIDQLVQYGSTMSQFWTWMVALAFSQAIFNRRLPSAWRLILAGLALATLYAAYGLMGWKSGWVPAMASLLVLVAFRSWRLGIALAVLGLVVGPGLLSEMIQSDEYSVLTRVEAWRLIAKIVKLNPVLGLGPANYSWYTPLFPILGYSVQFNSHNQYVDLLAQTGLLGLGCFLWFAWEVGRLGWRLRTSVPEGFATAYVYGALAGLAGTLVAGMLGDWFLPYVYNVTLSGMRSSLFGWLFLGGLVALQRMGRDSVKD